MSKKVAVDADDERRFRMSKSVSELTGLRKESDEGREMINLFNDLLVSGSSVTFFSPGPRR